MLISSINLQVLMLRLQDHDNKLNATEILNLLRPDHIAHVLGEAHDLLKAIDLNEDHELSFDEFAIGIRVVANNAFGAWASVKILHLIQLRRYFRFAEEVHQHIDNMYESMASRIRRIASRIKRDELWVEFWTVDVNLLCDYGSIWEKNNEIE